MDLSQKIETYQPDETVRHLIDTTKIVLLVGISGAGKDTLKQQLLQLPEFADIVSYTTRAPRQNQGVMEQDGADYHFISEEQAATMLDQHEFV